MTTSAVWKLIDGRLSQLFKQRSLPASTFETAGVLIKFSLPDMSDETRLLVQLSVCLCLIDVADGHTATDFQADVLNQRLHELINGEGALLDTNQLKTMTVSMSEASAHLKALSINDRPMFTTHSTSQVQLMRISALESQLEKKVRQLASEESTIDTSALNISSHLTAEQANAVRASIQHRISVITGGPGTGKTSIIVELLRCVVQLGIDPKRIALAAPTGKAAYRMGESIHAALEQRGDSISTILKQNLVPPSTLHRLLDYRPWTGQFNRHEQAPIKADLVIIDEMSMVDAELSAHILGALPDQSRLVMLGDPGQLPSVGAGAFLRDLVDTQVAHVSTLTKSFRMNKNDPAGSRVYETSRWVLDGSRRLLELPELQITWQDWLLEPPLGVNCARDITSNYGPFIGAWHERFYRRGPWQQLMSSQLSDDDEKTTEKLTEIFAHFSRARILCPTRVGPQGTLALNANFVSKIRADFSLEGPSGFGLGDLVMCTRNDYKLELFNGDQGVVLSKKEGEQSTLWVAFEGGETPRIYPLALISHNLEHAFAITIHKSQGSEFETVALSLPDTSAIPISRALVYTAITRAKREVLILGKQTALYDASKYVEIRKTGLNTRLARPTHMNEES
ncbi:MAG: ATP-dependent DNA helicase [Bradymonadia bacterium]